MGGYWVPRQNIFCTNSSSQKSITHKQTTMKEDSIAEMNRVIAVFDGWECYEDRAGIWFKKEGLIECLHPKLQELRYHSDWQSLMPVWHKFRDLRFEREKHSFVFSTERQYIGTMIAYHGIEEAHQALYNAICWYNTTINKES